MLRALRNIAILLLVQGLALGLYFFVEAYRDPNVELFRYEKLLSKELAPELMLQKDGGTVQLSSYRGEFVLLHFWATWCEPCQKELPALLKFSRELSLNKNLRLFAISEDRDWGAVRDFFDGKIPPEILWDASGEGEDAYEVSTLPDTYLLNPEGRLVLRFLGTRDWRSPEAKRLLTEVMNERQK
jgi:thiol-disulfide isomerase/thioredoxin